MSQSRSVLQGSNNPMGSDVETTRSDKGRVIADIESQIESLDNLHRWQTLVTSGLCWPMDEVNNILAHREGSTVRVLSVNNNRSGLWAVEMAKEFPHAEVLGIDRNPQRPSEIPSNCRFEVLDLMNDETTHLVGTFDIVHCVRGAGWMRPQKPFWAKVATLVKPGGLLLYVVCDMTVFDEHKNVMKPAEIGQEPGTGSWFARLGSELEKYAPVSLDVPHTVLAESVRNWMREDPRLEEVKENAVFVPIGWPGTEEDKLENREEIGRLVGMTAIGRGSFVKPTLLANGMPEEEVDLCLQECEADILGQRLKSYSLWHFFAARRRAP